MDEMDDVDKSFPSTLSISSISSIIFVQLIVVPFSLFVIRVKKKQRVQIMIRWLSIFLVLTISLTADEPDLLDRSLEYAKGHQEFKEVFFKLHEKEFVRLVKEGQSPKALLISCSDSRVEPSLFLGSKPGDLFVIRTAGNFVPIYDTGIAWDGVAATIEYAVEALGVKDIIVCGHSHCGAIKGLFQPLDSAKFALLKKWLRFGQKVKEITMKTCTGHEKEGECLVAAEQLSVVFQLKHLMSYPFVKKLVDEGTLYLHGWYYIIETGAIHYYDPEKNDFFPLAM